MHASKALNECHNKQLDRLPSHSHSTPHVISSQYVARESSQLSCHQTVQVFTPFSLDIRRHFLLLSGQKHDKNKRKTKNAISFWTLSVLSPLPRLGSALLMDLHVDCCSRAGPGRAHAKLPVRKCASQDIPFRGFCSGSGQCLGLALDRNRN